MMPNPLASSPESTLAKRCERTPKGILRSIKCRLGARQGETEELPHISDLNFNKGVMLSLSLPVCL